MDFKRLFLTTVSMFAIFSSPSFAVSTKSLEVFTDCSSQKISIDIFNHGEVKEFVKVRMSKYENYENGKLSKKSVSYQEGQIKGLDLVSKPNRLILGPSEKRSINFYQLSDICNSDKDEIYSVSFVPSAVPGSGNSVNLFMGMGTLLTVLPKNPKLDYEIDRIDDKVIVKNTGDSVIFISVDSCGDNLYKSKSDKCLVKTRVHHTLERVIDVSKFKNKVLVTLTSPANGNWVKEVEL